MSEAAISDGSVVFFGRHAVDHYLKCARWPHEGQKVNATSMGRKFGGMIPNAAAIFGGYGRAPLLLGPLEDNADGPLILNELADAGVDTRQVRVTRAVRNSQVYNFLSEANPNEKTMIMDDPEYEFELTPDEHRTITGARFLYTTIAHLRRIAGVREVLAAARANGVRLFIDAEAETFKSAQVDWWAFSSTHFLSFNEESLATFCTGTTADKMIAEILQETQGEVITTLGKEGCEVATLAGKIRLPGIPVQAADPLGAGDTFNATYLYARAAGWEIRRAAEFANAAAARSTMFFGPRSGSAPIDTIEAFIKSTAQKGASFETQN